MAVLGLLAERPRHPYDIAFTMHQRHMDRHIKLSLGSLYHLVEQLQRVGWVRPTDVSREGRRPERTVYSVTEVGRERFLLRLRELLAEPVDEYSSFEAGLSFLHQLAPQEAASLLRERAAALERQMEEWEGVASFLHQERGLMRLALIEAELVQGTRGFQAEWSRRIAAEIESGALVWQTHVAEGATEEIHS